jgi:hypothetical protein
MKSADNIYSVDRNLRIALTLDTAPPPELHITNHLK